MGHPARDIVVQPPLIGEPRPSETVHGRIVLHLVRRFGPARVLRHAAMVRRVADRIERRHAAAAWADRVADRLF